MKKVEYHVTVTHHKNGIFEFSINGLGDSKEERKMASNDLAEISEMLDDGDIEPEMLQ